MARALIAAWAATYIALVSSFGVGGGSGVGIGVNWGTMMSHPMHPATVAAMLHSNGIAKVKLFDADPWTVAALAGSAVEAMLAIPNDQLARVAASYDHARQWVKHNVSNHDHDGGVRIKYHSLSILRSRSPANFAFFFFLDFAISVMTLPV